MMIRNRLPREFETNGGTALLFAENEYREPVMVPTDEMPVRFDEEAYPHIDQERETFHDYTVYDSDQWNGEW
jgi:AAA+ superfamily predicted ATPase